MPSGQETKVKDIVFYKDSLTQATAGQAITITLEDEVDVSRGDLLCGAKTVNATVTKIKHQVNVNTLDKLAAEKLTLNAVATCNISTDAPLVFDPYAENKVSIRSRPSGF
jgi:bifunctional enzyme CysN/CysC